MPQVIIFLKPSEKDASTLLADQERRKLHGMAGLLVREGLELRKTIEPFPILERSTRSIEKEVANNTIHNLINLPSTY